MSAAIRIENLGKRYLIDHEAQNRGYYRTLRESIMDLAAAPARWLSSKFKVQSSKLRLPTPDPRLPTPDPHSPLTTHHSPASRPRHEQFWALKDVSFEVQPGEVVGIIGRNGAGKSTLLKILSQITKPTTGRVELHGRVGSLLEVGTGFHPELTGRENIYLNGSILGMRKAEIDRKFDEIVDFAEIEQFLDTPVKRYSSGMYVRLAFAVAAHLEPEILIVDEVLAVGDLSFQKKCLGKISEIATGGRTVMFVSHNMAAVAQMCDRAAWIDKGQIRRAGRVETVLRSYLEEGNSQIAKRSWRYPGDAPGDDRVRLLGCSVRQRGMATGVIDINEPSRVHLEFEVLRPARDLITGVSYYNNLNECIFASCDWRPNHLAPGCYLKYVEIPAHLLAEGHIEVLVQLVFLNPDVKSVIMHGVLAFDAVDSDHPEMVRGHYKGPWPGVVRVGLPWSDAARYANPQEPPQS